MRSKKAMYNILAMGICEIASIICSMILPRLVIGTFGSDYNGVTTSVTQFLQLISILQAGIGGATRVVLYRAIADKDQSRINGILKANLLYMRKVAYFFLTYVAIMAVGYKFVANTSVGWGESALLILIVGMGTFAQYFFGITYQTLLKADQKIYIYYIFQTVAVLANTIISVTLINMNLSIHMVKFGSSIVFCATPIALGAYVKRKYAVNLNCKPDLDSLKDKNNVMVHTIADIAYDNMPLLALTFFCSTKLVSVYTVYNTVFNGLRKLAMVFTGGLEGAYGNMWAKGERELLKKRTMTYEFFISAFVSIIFSATMFLIIPFISIYTEGVTDINYVRPGFAFVAVCASMMYCIRMPYTTLIQACGKYKETKYGIYTELLIQVIGSIVLTPKFGLVAPVLLLFVVGLIRTVYFMIYLYTTILSIPITAFIKRMLWVFTNIVIIELLLTALIDATAIVSWPYWVAYGVLSVCVAAVIVIITAWLFYRDEVYNVCSVLRKMLQKRENRNDKKKYQ